MNSNRGGKQIRAALYGRVSTSEQRVGLQMEELRTVARQRGWLVVGEYTDEGLSGSAENRPALDEMMTLARNGKINLIAVWRFDRFARSTQHLLKALDEFRQIRVDFISLREAMDTSTSTGKMVFTFLAAVAEFERALIRERVKAGVARAQANGQHCGRPRHEIDLRAARILLAQGQSVRQVAEMLGIPRGTLRRRLQELGEGGSKVMHPVATETAPLPGS